MGTTLGTTHLIEHEINVGTAEPTNKRYYSLSPVVQQRIDAALDEMIRDGIVEPSISPWCSPVLLIPKKDRSSRFCIGYRKVNSH